MEQHRITEKKTCPPDLIEIFKITDWENKKLPLSPLFHTHRE